MSFHNTCAPRTCASNCCPWCSVLCLCTAVSVHNPVLVSVTFPVSVSALLRARSPLFPSPSLLGVWTRAARIQATQKKIQENGAVI